MLHPPIATLYKQQNTIIQPSIQWRISYGIKKRSCSKLIWFSTIVQWLIVCCITVDVSLFSNASCVEAKRHRPSAQSAIECEWSDRGAERKHTHDRPLECTQKMACSIRIRSERTQQKRRLQYDINLFVRQLYEWHTHIIYYYKGKYSMQSCVFFGLQPQLDSFIVERKNNLVTILSLAYCGLVWLFRSTLANERRPQHRARFVAALCMLNIFHMLHKHYRLLFLTLTSLLDACGPF